MGKWTIRNTAPQKTVGVYLKAVKALNDLEALGEETGFHAWEPVLVGITGRIVKRDGKWIFLEW